MSGSRRIVGTLSAALVLGLPLVVSGTSVAQSAPARQHTGKVWVSITAGDAHTCGIRLDKTLWCWGANAHGELGLGDNENRLVPTQVGDDSWIAVSAGEWGDTCGIKKNLSLWCWGDNPYGQLGSGDAGGTKLVPTQVEGHHDWIAVTMGLEQTCGIQPDGSLWCWGGNSSGQVGVGSDAYLVLDPTQVAPGSDWLTMAAGEYHTCGVQADHSLWCWGDNNEGELGVGSRVSWNVPVRVGSDSDWTGVSASDFYTCGVRAQETLWCWGYNDKGQLGVGDTVPRTTPTHVAGGWTDVSAASFGSSTCARSLEGSLFCWGWGHYGQLGYGGRDDQPTPLQVGTRNDWGGPITTGELHTCAIRASHLLLCWGWNDYGQLGIGTQHRQLTPKIV